ncbi:Histidinol dehydrogenase like protein [Verticillium longisporum]|uniref:Histidinol dehydrogenase n=1 Tax=Verticillium longisporum TaxID=100787 RepID=A0A0G4M6S9_VERLO|nr:Histidinol dehydrogenase like protein [Verticillium longisporum]KAG7122970.1 Histidinol dehydrogenase like protein [Verticillium longisporum]CRK24413.1 hypothetical protein BN1723_013296 [Verticillium longisporum]CRK29887.1 hypothetical protein BN1708_015709 [Verticillium longisporum]
MNSRFLKSALLSARVESNQRVTDVVQAVIQDVRKNGDKAVRSYSERFEKWTPPSFKLTERQIQDCIAQVPAQTVQDIKTAQENVRKFAQAQRGSIRDIEVEIQPDFILGHKSNPINRVGAYIPGGRYPLLASAHMTITTAKVAGVPQVIACTPPLNGNLPNATVAAAHFAGADEIFILGGAQAIAAMAVGTETMKKVDFIAGPGNAFVAEAKRLLFGEIGIDLFAGPTETLIIADESADPSPPRQIFYPRPSTVPILPPCSSPALSPWANKPSDMSIRYSKALDKMTNYGALFLGEKTTVSFGDKCIGTNHVLPTRKAGNYTGGLWVGKFLKTQTYQEILDEKASGEMGRLCARCSRAENFEGHARSGDLRAHKYLGDDHDWVKEAKGDSV